MHSDPVQAQQLRWYVMPTEVSLIGVCIQILVIDRCLTDLTYHLCVIRLKRLGQSRRMVQMMFLMRTNHVWKIPGKRLCNQVINMISLSTTPTTPSRLNERGRTLQGK